MKRGIIFWIIECVQKIVNLDILKEGNIAVIHVLGIIIVIISVRKSLVDAVVRGLAIKLITLQFMVMMNNLMTFNISAGGEDSSLC